MREVSIRLATGEGQFIGLCSSAASRRGIRQKLTVTHRKQPDFELAQRVTLLQRDREVARGISCSGLAMHVRGGALRVMSRRRPPLDLAATQSLPR